MTSNYKKLFSIEMEGWCFGIEQYPGEIFPGLIHTILRELSPSFKKAINEGLIFDILDLSLKFSKAAKYIVHEKEIAFSMLARLPHPSKLTEDERFTLAQIIDPVEKEYGGAIVRLEKKWAYEAKKAA